MFISSGTTFRNFAAKNEFAFYFDITHSTSTGISEIGFSGDSGVLPFFYFNNGNITDFNYRSIWGYNPRQVTRFSGNIGVNYINYFINDKPICLFSPKNNNLFYNCFYAKTSGSDIDFNFNIFAPTPQYTLNFPSEVLFGNKLTGVISNQEININKSIQIFSGSLFNNNYNYNIEFLPLSKISGMKSGNIVLTPNFGAIENITNIVNNNSSLLLFTNFGQVLYPLTFDILPGPIYFLEFYTGFTGSLGFVDNFTYEKYYNYELRSLSPENRNLHIFLKNISGHTGQLVNGEFAGSGNIQGIASGFVYGFDYITGTATGTGIAFLGTDYYGNFPTGTFKNNIKLFQYATGTLIYNYGLPLLGGSGTGPSPDGTIISATGFLTEPLSGFVFGYGSYQNNKIIDLTGLYYDSINIKTGSQTLETTGFYSGSYYFGHDNLLWKSNNIVTGNGFTGFGNLFYNIKGSVFGNINPGDLGEITFNTDIYSTQLTGSLLTPLIKQNEGVLINSGIATASENSSNANRALTGENYFYLTNSTGWINFQFTNYPTSSKRRIFHYSFLLDFNSTQYPYIFDLQLSTNNISWVTIDSKTGNELFLRQDPLNFYNYPKEIILTCQSPNTLINNSAYSFLRLNIRSGKNWLHDFDLGKSPGIGIKNLEVYGVPFPNVTLNNSELFSKYDVVPNLTGYNQPSGNILNNNSFSGEVIYSKDFISFPAWQAFNKNKNLYPYAEISGDNNGDIYIGYNSINVFDLTGFYVEFENGFRPTGVICEASRDGIIYTPLFWDYDVTSNTMDTNFSILRTGYKSVRLRFNDIIEVSSSSSTRICVNPEGNVDVNSVCYKQVIDSDPFCCDILWDQYCTDLYNNCPEISSSSSSSSSSLSSSSSSSSSIIQIPENNMNLWLDNKDESKIIFVNAISSSSSSVACVTPSAFINTNSACYKQVIQNLPYCCNTFWDLSCNSSYNNCIGLIDKVFIYSNNINLLCNSQNTSINYYQNSCGLGIGCNFYSGDGRTIANNGFYLDKTTNKWVNTTNGKITNTGECIDSSLLACTGGSGIFTFVFDPSVLLCNGRYLNTLVDNQTLVVKQNVQMPINNSSRNIYQIQSGGSDTWTIGTWATWSVITGSNLWVGYGRENLQWNPPRLQIAPTGWTVTNLPPGLSMPKYNLISGAPTVLGEWKTSITYRFPCNENTYLADPKIVNIKVCKEVSYPSSSSSAPCNVDISSLYGGMIDSACYQQVIKEDPYCCYGKWDTSCEIRYGGCACILGNPSPVTFNGLSCSPGGKLVTLSTNQILRIKRNTPIWVNNGAQICQGSLSTNLYCLDPNRNLWCNRAGGIEPISTIDVNGSLPAGLSITNHNLIAGSTNAPLGTYEVLINQIFSNGTCYIDDYYATIYIEICS
jgi:hypothetical protein